MLPLDVRGMIDRSRFPTADDKYIPKQRREIDGGIAPSLTELKPDAPAAGLAPEPSSR
jgi:hypothetical protein